MSEYVIHHVPGEPGIDGGRKAADFVIDDQRGAICFSIAEGIALAQREQDKAQKLAAERGPNWQPPPLPPAPPPDTYEDLIHVNWFQLSCLDAHPAQAALGRESHELSERWMALFAERRERRARQAEQLDTDEDIARLAVIDREIRQVEVRQRDVLAKMGPVRARIRGAFRKFLNESPVLGFKKFATCAPVWWQWFPTDNLDHVHRDMRAMLAKRRAA